MAPFDDDRRRRLLWKSMRWIGVSFRRHVAVRGAVGARLPATRFSTTPESPPSPRCSPVALARHGRSLPRAAPARNEEAAVAVPLHSLGRVSRLETAEVSLYSLMPFYVAVNWPRGREFIRNVRSFDSMTGAEAVYVGPSDKYR